MMTDIPVPNRAQISFVNKGVNLESEYDGGIVESVRFNIRRLLRAVYTFNNHDHDQATKLQRFILQADQNETTFPLYGPNFREDQKKQLFTRVNAIHTVTYNAGTKEIKLSHANSATAYDVKTNDWIQVGRYCLNLFDVVKDVNADGNTYYTCTVANMPPNLNDLPDDAEVKWGKGNYHMIAVNHNFSYTMSRDSLRIFSPETVEFWEVN